VKRVLILVAAMALGVGLACGESLDELLLDALCNDDGDCAPGQTCFRTAYQVQAGAQGWCRNGDSCSTGTQPGCSCENVGATYGCTNTTESTLLESSSDESCECFYKCSSSEFPQTGCPGNLVASDMENLSASDCVCLYPGG
jgi:hypothetical protein